MNQFNVSMVCVGLSLFFAVLAAVIHVYIFALESLLWNKSKTRKLFGIRDEAQFLATKSLAFNQGFYNLFLAVTIAASFFTAYFTEYSASAEIGAWLRHFALGSILAAAIVLFFSNRKMIRAVIIQGAPALLYFIFWILFVNLV
jgi:putative membrane protein